MVKKVYFKKCSNYNVFGIENVIKELFSSLSIDPQTEFIGKRILLKPNMLGAYHPDKAVTTHPAVVEAVIKIVAPYAKEVWIGDSPNGVQRSIDHVWRETGLEPLTKKYDIKKKVFEKGGASVVNGVLISNVVLEADYIINLPKLKTHGLTLLTAAVKNMFGIVPGLKKAAYHRDTGSKEKFAETIVKISEVRKADLTIVDGITGMCGNGPSGGYPVDTNLIIAGRNIHEIDLSISKLLHIPSKDIDTLAAAERLGIIDLNEERDGDPDPLSISDQFKLPVTYTLGFGRSKFFNSLIRRYMNRLKVRPEVNKRKCVKCGMCVKICPVNAISFVKEFPKVDHNRCIGCYCCHEACPEKAMDLKESFILRFLKR